MSTPSDNPDTDAALAYVEQQFDERVSFRKGWPMLPDLPLATVHDEDILSKVSFPDYNYHMNTISRELDQIVKRMHLVHRVPSRDTPLSSKTATLLVVAVPNGPIDPIPGYKGGLNLYSFAVRALRRYLKEEDIHIQIEIIDEQIYEWKLLPSNRPNTDADCVIVDAWYEAKPKFLKLLSDHGLGMSKVDFLLRGPDHGTLKGRPTAMISTSNPQGVKWGAEILPQLRLMVEPLIKVEVVSVGYGAI